MPVNAQEVASAIVRFVGDLKPLQKDAAAVKKEIDQLSKSSFGKELSKAAQEAGRGMLDLAKNVFYVREAIQTVIGIAGTLARAFLQPAMEIEKTRNALIGILGSGEQADAMLSTLGDTANKFGLDLKGLQEQSVTLSIISDGDIQMANEYATALARINSIRPDLPQMRQLGTIFALREGDFARASMLLDIPAEKLRALAGVAEETGDAVKEATGDVAMGGEQALGQYTSIVREAEGAGACGKNLAENIKKGLSTSQINALLAGLGASDQMMALVGDSMSSKLQKLGNDWLEFRQTVGMKVLEALAGPLDTLLGWLTENEDKLVELAETFGGILAEGVQKFLEWLTPEKLDQIAASVISLAGSVASLVSSFLAMPSWAQGIIAGGAMMLGPMGGGKALLGAGGKALLGGATKAGAAAAAEGASIAPSAARWAAYVGGGGEAAVAGAGGTAAAAGGLTALGIGASAVGGIGLGLGVNELISRSEWGKEHGVQSTKNIASVAAYGAGKLFGGEDLGKQWFQSVSGVAPETQKVEVVVTVEDDGAIRAYTKDQIDASNDQIAAGFIGGGTGRGSMPTFGGWGSK